MKFSLTKQHTKKVEKLNRDLAREQAKLDRIARVSGVWTKPSQQVPNQSQK
jgi:hypothetical protein